MSTSGSLEREYGYGNVIRTDVVSTVHRLLNAVPDVAEHHRRSKAGFSVMDLIGLGQHIWQGVDAQRYVRELRDERNAR